MTLDHLHTRLLDADIQYLIRAKAGQLATAHGFGRSDREDLAQELTLRLLQRLKAYDPAKASFYCFALVVLDRAAKTLLESRSAARRDSTGSVSLQSAVATADGGSSPLADLVGPEERSNRVGRFVAPEDEARELALDVRAVLDALPARVRKLAGRLATQSRAENLRENFDFSDANINRNRDRIKAEILDDRRRRQRDADAARRADAAGAMDDVRRAADDLRAAVDEAARKRAALGEKVAPKARGSMSSLDDVIDLSKKVDLQGTFNALAVRGGD